MTTQRQPGNFNRSSGLGVYPDNVNWGLIAHTTANIPWTNTIPGNLFTDYSYQLDGTGVDIVIVDTGVEAYHPEFILDADSSICLNNSGSVVETTVNTRNTLRGITRYNNNIIAVGDRGEIRYNTQLVSNNAQNYAVMDVTAWSGQLYAVGGFYADGLETRPDTDPPRGPGIKILTSPTGQVWQDITPYGANNSYARSQLRGIAGSATSLVAVGTPDYTVKRFDQPQYGYVAPTARILRYNSGVWTNITTNFSVPLNYNLNRVRYFNSAYYAVGDAGTIIRSTTDGVSWTRSTSGVACGLQDVTANAAGTVIVAVGRGGCVVTSTDGLTWTQRASGTAADLFCVTYSQGQFWAMGQNGAGIRSSDGTTWTAFSTGTVNTVYAAQGQDWATGAGTRVQAYDWSTLGVSGTAASVAVGGYLGDANDAAEGGGHGSNVTGIAAGRTNGWAKNSRIYSLRVFTGTDITTGSMLSSINNDPTQWGVLLQQFHENKPGAGTRPTVANMSIGFRASLAQSTIMQIEYRQQYYYPNPAQVGAIVPSLGIINSSRMMRLASVDSPLIAAMDAGVIIVGAAGNYSYKCDVPGGADYNNKLYLNYNYNVSYPYMQGQTPGAAGNLTTGSAVICVGAVDTALPQQKVQFSNTGARVDIYAAGVGIMGPYKNAIAGNNNNSILDPRCIGTGSYFFLNEIAGTSQASPQVAGVCALLAQQNPAVTPAGMRQALRNSALTNRLNVTNSEFQNNSTLPNYVNYTSLQGGDNRFLYLSAIPFAAGDIDWINGVQGQGEIDLE